MLSSGAPRYRNGFYYLPLTLNDLYKCTSEVLRGGVVGGSQISPEFLKGRS